MPRRSLLLDVSGHEHRPAHSMLRELEWSVGAAEGAESIGVTARGVGNDRVVPMLRNIARVTGPTVVKAARRRVDLPAGRDLAFASVISFRDLWVLAGLDLRSVARRRICYILELWDSEVHHFDLYRDILDQFDAVFTVHESSVAALRAAISAPVHWLPTGTDAALHAPVSPGPRDLDVLSIGRRCPVQHAELVAAARDGVVGYQFDSLGGGQFDDWQQHRMNMAGQGRRAAFYIAHRAKFDVPIESGQAQDFGNRFFDAAAAGSIPIGEVPTTDSFRAYFPDAADMVYVPTGSTGVVEAVLAHRADPEAWQLTSTRLVCDALRRHDWAHRWRTMLEAVELEPSASARNRVDRLAELAACIEAGEPATELRAEIVRAQWCAT